MAKDRKLHSEKVSKVNTGSKPKVKRANRPNHICEFTDSNGIVCSQKFGRLGNLKRHIREKHTGYLYSCGIAKCNFWSANPSRVSDHKSSGHQIRTGDLDPEAKSTVKSCEKCSSNFRTEHFYNRHMEMGECVSMPNFKDLLIAVFILIRLLLPFFRNMSI